MMEEEKQSRVHLDIAKRIVETLCMGEEQVSQQTALQVLKPLLEENITYAVQKQHRIPEKWFKNLKTPKNNLLNELAAYLQRIEFIETKSFTQDFEKKFNEFYAQINENQQPYIEIANKYQSLHIGCNNYQEVRSPQFLQVSKSHEEVEKYTQFFKKEQGYDLVLDITDQSKMKQVNLQSKITELLIKMISTCDGNGINPFVVNVITFTGHGITYDNDAIAVIPEYDEEVKKNDEEIKQNDEKQKVLRFINFSHWARKFAEIKNTLSIFILSMCRIQVDKADKEKLVREAFLNQKHSEQYVFKNLVKDAHSENTKSLHQGYSVMLFGTRTGQVVHEGDLFEKFFDSYNKMKHINDINLGWELINKQFCEDYLSRFCTKSNPEHLFRIKFLDAKKSIKHNQLTLINQSKLLKRSNIDKSSNNNQESQLSQTQQQESNRKRENKFNDKEQQKIQQISKDPEERNRMLIQLFKEADSCIEKIQKQCQLTKSELDDLSELFSGDDEKEEIMQGLRKPLDFRPFIKE